MWPGQEPGDWLKNHFAWGVGGRHVGRALVGKGRRECKAQNETAQSDVHYGLLLTNRQEVFLTLLPSEKVLVTTLLPTYTSVFAFVP